MDALAAERIFLFEGFRLDRRAGGLFRVGDNGAVLVPLGSRALDILGVLVARPGELVSKDEIVAPAWPGVIVEDSNLPTQISALRRVLDEASPIVAAASRQSRGAATALSRRYLAATATAPGCAASPRSWPPMSPAIRG